MKTHLPLSCQNAQKNFKTKFFSGKGGGGAESPGEVRGNLRAESMGSRDRQASLVWAISQV